MSTQKMTSDKTFDMHIWFARIHPDAKLPTRAYASAGYDLACVHEVKMPPRSSAIVSTGLVCTLPNPPQPFAVFGHVKARSGWSFKNDIEVGAGTIDADYRGEIKVKLYNISDKEFQFAKGDKVAQLIVEVILTPPVMETTVELMQQSDRGTRGFGSSN